MGRPLVVRPVAGEEGDLVSLDASDRDLTRRRAERSGDLLEGDVVEERVEARPAEDPDQADLASDLPDPESFFDSVLVSVFVSPFVSDLALAPDLRDDRLSVL